MTTLHQVCAFSISDDWTPEQAMAVLEVLHSVEAALWRSYGRELHVLFVDKRLTEDDDPDDTDSL